MVNNQQKCNKTKKKSGSLVMTCDWVDCGLKIADAQEMIEHVEVHAKEGFTEEREGRQQYCCMWEMCDFVTACENTIVLHINYHGYHTRLKAIGTALLSVHSNLDCYRNMAECNMIGMINYTSRCEWEGCYFNTDNYALLLQHTNTHVTGQPRREKNQFVYCHWQGCGRKLVDMTKLKSHVRTHTQEKAVACPVCGFQFASKTKFIDHCHRQVQHSLRTSKCSYCKKMFPSARIMQDHFRNHVHMYKCSMCDMTCPYKHSLATHIRYRHLKDRPFHCNFCNDSFKTELDLKTHYQAHSDENCWVCEEPGCDFRARSNNGLSTHIRKVHGQMAEYGCHMCSATYHRGAALTLHLKRVHAYRWASGTSRFRYIKDDSGVHRLLTEQHVRVEVVEQIVANRRPGQRKRFAISCVEPTSISITEQPTSSRDDSSEIDDPESDVDMGCEGEEFSRSERSETEHNDMSQLLQEDEDQSFGENLKKHLGVTGGFITVVQSQ